MCHSTSWCLYTNLYTAVPAWHVRETFTFAVRIKWSILHSTGYCGIRADSYYNVGLCTLGLSICKSRAGDYMTSKAFRPAMGPIQPPTQWGQGLFPEGKRQGCEADHSSPSSAKVKNTWTQTSAPPYAFNACTRINFTLQNTFASHTLVFLLCFIHSSFYLVTAMSIWCRFLPYSHIF